MTLTKKDVGYFARIIGVLLVITMCVALLLSAVNMITKDKIAANEKAKLEAAISAIFSNASSPVTTKLDLSYENETLTSFNLVTDGDAAVGYYAEVSPVGFKGKVTMLVGLTLNGEVCGIRVISHGETVGIGDKIEDEGFLGTFYGVSTQDAANKVDLISGATYSSKAVRNGVSTAINAYNAFYGGAEQ